MGQVGKLHFGAEIVENHCFVKVLGSPWLKNQRTLLYFKGLGKTRAQKSWKSLDRFQGLGKHGAEKSKTTKRF